MPQLSDIGRQRLIKKAKHAGFTEDGLRQMLNHIGLNLNTMTTEEFERVLPYVNEFNAPKFTGAA